MNDKDTNKVKTAQVEQAAADWANRICAADAEKVETGNSVAGIAEAYHSAISQQRIRCEPTRLRFASSYRIQRRAVAQNGPKHSAELALATKQVTEAENKNAD